MNLLEIYQTAVDGVMKQGKPSVKAGTHLNQCMLRAPDGSMCAVGQFLKDMSAVDVFGLEEYSDLSCIYASELEDFAKSELGKALAERIGELTEDKLELLSDLQAWHDEANEHPENHVYEEPLYLKPEDPA